MNCQICLKFPEVIHRYIASNNKKIPAIAKAEGTRYRTDVIESHMKAEYHIQCVKALRLKSITNFASKEPLDVMISKGNVALADRIGRIATTIFNDAKKLTLAAWNWPSRYVSSEIGRMFSFNSPKESTENVN